MKKRKQNKSNKSGIVRSCLFYFVLIFLVGVIATFGIGITIISSLSKQIEYLEQSIEVPKPLQTTILYDRNGKEIGELYIQNREWAKISEIPTKVQLAFISTEDHKFFEHSGVNFTSIIRALIVNLISGRIEQGASTITQQLARELFLTKERTMQRKWKELLLAIMLERNYSKMEILERYLNQIYFGSGAYGVKTAAKTFFNKELKQLTISDCALLTAFQRNPSYYSPYKHLDNAIARRNFALKRMFELNAITKNEYEDALNEKPKIAKFKKPSIGFENTKAPYFISYVAEVLKGKYGSERVFEGGLKVYTSLDAHLQEVADEAVRWGVNQAIKDKKNVTQGALIAMDLKTGDILAMVGGLDFVKSKFNRTYQAKRQPGSAFKPFVYTTALMKGYSIYNNISDSPISFKIPDSNQYYTPHNYDSKYKGMMTFENALVYSRNVPAVRIANMVGPHEVVRTAKRMGIKSQLTANLSIALGTSEVTMLEMITAFSPFAKGGIRIEPRAIIEVHSPENTILEKNNSQERRVIEKEVADTITYVLKQVIQRGTATRANIGKPAAGKTGTTSDFRDAWFVGYTPDIICATWVGNDNNESMNKVQGGSYPAMIWKKFMQEATKNLNSDFNLEPIFIKPTKSEPAKLKENSNLSIASGTNLFDFEEMEKKNKPTQ